MTIEVVDRCNAPVRLAQRRRRVSSLILFPALLSVFLLSGCDWWAQRQCQWYLMPDTDPKRDGTTETGFIPVCARNLDVNKEYCKIQASMAFTEKNYGKKFRYVDMELDLDSAFPRKVKDIKFCDK